MSASGDFSVAYTRSQLGGGAAQRVSPHVNKVRSRPPASQTALGNGCFTSPVYSRNPAEHAVQVSSFHHRRNRVNLGQSKAAEAKLLNHESLERVVATLFDNRSKYNETGLTGQTPVAPGDACACADSSQARRRQRCTRGAASCFDNRPVGQVVAGCPVWWNVSYVDRKRC